MNLFTDEQQASIARDPDDGVDARSQAVGRGCHQGADGDHEADEARMTSSRADGEQLPAREVAPCLDIFLATTTAGSTDHARRAAGGVQPRVAAMMIETGARGGGLLLLLLLLLQDCRSRGRDPINAVLRAEGAARQAARGAAA